MKKFFRIETKYKFEWNDLRAFLMLINFALVVLDFSVGAIFGLTIATLGLVKDLTVDRHISGMIMHLTSMALNSYILFFI